MSIKIAHQKLLHKYSQLSEPTKAAIWFTICNVMLKGISFFTVPIFTRLMTDEEYGTLSLFLSYQQIILIFATWEIQMGAYQKGIFNYKSDLRFFTKSTQLLINIITVIVFSFLFLANDWIERTTGMGLEIISLLLIYMLLQPSYNCWLVRKRTTYEYKKAVTATLLYSLAVVLVPMVALNVFSKTAEIKYKSELITTIVMCIIFYIPNAKYSELRRNKQLVKKQWMFLLKFEGPLVLHSLSYLILSQADRIMIGNLVGKTETAYYSVAHGLAFTVSILQNSINQALLPWRYQMLEARQYEKIKKITNYLLLLIGAVVLMFILVAPEIMRMLFEKNYYEAVWSIPPLSVSIYFMFLYTIFVNIETYYEQTKYVMYVSAICGMVNVALNYMCIGIFGYIVCGYTTLFSYALFAIGHYYFMKKIIKKEAPNTTIVDTKMIVIISIAIVAISILFTVLYSYVTIRYGIIIIAIVLMMVFRRKIMFFAKELKKKDF